MNDLVVETRALTKCFGNKTALNNFTIQIPTGGTHALVGSNGAGKSTLFRLLLGILEPTSGISMLLGANCAELPPETRGRIGYVNEEHTLPNWMTVAQVTQLQKSFYPNWDQAIYGQVIGNFDVGTNQKVSSLSRGERAGFNLSMALAQKPDLLILDEPTLGMDVVAKQAFLESLIFTGSDLNTTVIYCSHQMEEVERLADTLIIMEKGTLRNFSRPDEFQARISYWIADFSTCFSCDQLPGFLYSKEIEGQYHLTVIDQPESFADSLRQMGADSVQKCPVNLEHAVNAFLAKNHDAPHRAS